LVSAGELKSVAMRKSKWIKILASIGVIILIVFVVIPPFTRKWYRHHLLKYAPPAPTSKWRKFSSLEGKFSIWFPGTPVETNKFVTNSIMAVKEHIYSLLSRLAFDDRNFTIVKTG
jgi:hypothetical protein